MRSVIDAKVAHPLRPFLHTRLSDFFVVFYVCRFEGEDIYAQERRKIQAEQTKVWLDQQMDEKERGERERREAEEAYREATRARDQQAQDLDKLEKECRQRLSLACTDYNKALVFFIIALYCQHSAIRSK